MRIHLLPAVRCEWWRISIRTRRKKINMKKRVCSKMNERVVKNDKINGRSLKNCTANEATEQCHIAWLCVCLSISPYVHRVVVIHFFCHWIMKTAFCSYAFWSEMRCSSFLFAFFVIIFSARSFHSSQVCLNVASASQTTFRW